MSPTHGKLLFLETKIKMPLMNLPVRTVVVPTSSSRMMISPGSRLSPEQLKEAGAITDIVAPNIFHGAGVKRSHEAHPSARTWGPKGLAAQKPDVTWTHELTEASWSELHRELPAVEIKGMKKVNEVVFVDPDTRSLIVCDLCFNLANERGLGARIILGLFGTYGKFGVSKFFLKFIDNRSEMLESLKKIFSHDFDNIIVSHGLNVIGNGKDQLRRALNEKGVTGF